jgi:hypothetical protein
MVFTGAALLARRPVGYLLGSVFVVKAVAMACAICAMLISAWAVEGSFDAAAFAIFGSAALAAALIGVRMYRSVLPEGGTAP